MSKLNQPLYDLALEVGGSHYPSVVNPYLEKTVRLIIEQSAEVAQLSPEVKQKLKDHWGIN